MLFMILYALRIISVHKTLNFVYFLPKRDIHTDGPTDIPSYRDARTHLKNKTKQNRRKLEKKEKQKEERMKTRREEKTQSVRRSLARSVCNAFASKL